MTALSRRTLLAGLAATPVLTACGRAEPGTGDPTASSVPARFTYTDARGTTIDLDQVPTSVVAQSSAAAALWDAGFRVKGAYGELQAKDGKLDYQAGNLDLSQISRRSPDPGEVFRGCAPQRCTTSKNLRAALAQRLLSRTQRSSRPRKWARNWSCSCAG
jgi:hypothetical protein